MLSIVFAQVILVFGLNFNRADSIPFTKEEILILKKEIPENYMVMQKECNEYKFCIRIFEKLSKENYELFSRKAFKLIISSKFEHLDEDILLSILFDHIENYHFWHEYKKLNHFQRVKFIRHAAESFIVPSSKFLKFSKLLKANDPNNFPLSQNLYLKFLE